MVVRGKRHHARALRQRMGMDWGWLEGSAAVEGRQQQGGQQQGGAAGAPVPAPLQQDGAQQGRRQVGQQRGGAGSTCGDVQEVDLQVAEGQAAGDAALPPAAQAFHFDAAPPGGVAEAPPGGRPGGPTLMHIVDHEGIVESPGRVHELQQLMIQHMNELPWRKMDVDMGHFHAHAAIVCRDGRFGDRGKDVLRCCAESMLLLP
jgi:hypothetical protein